MAPESEIRVPGQELKTPVLLLIYRRPVHTERVLAAIREVQPSQIFVAADGPKPNDPDEAEKVEQARQVVANGVDWDCEFHQLFREQNLGCKYGVATGIDWFFDHVEQGIILEDDTLPSLSFFYYCEELLERYKHDTRVMKIAGYNLLDGKYQNGHSYIMSRFSFTWGWATWRRAWELNDVEMTSWPQFKSEGLHKQYPFSKERNEIFEDTYRNKIDTWDYQWDFAMTINNGLHCVPVRSLIKNIGFDASATHTREPEKERGSIPNNDIRFPLDHPSFIFPDERYERSLINRATQPRRGHRRALSKIKSILQKQTQSMLLTKPRESSGNSDDG